MELFCHSFMVTVTRRPNCVWQWIGNLMDASLSNKQIAYMGLS